jgi:predicted transport protein
VNVKIELVTLEVQKNTLSVPVKLQCAKLQDYKVNLKDAMGCPRNNNEEIGKI